MNAGETLCVIASLFESTLKTGYKSELPNHTAGDSGSV
jgi:hypothetical protein